MLIFYGWYVVACAFLLAVWAWGLGFYGLGIYLVSLQTAHGWSTSAISGAITTYYLIGAAFIAFVGAVMRRLGHAATVLAGISAMALGVTSLTVISELWQLYLALTVMAIGWSAMSGASINILVAPWFVERRGLALSLAFTGASCGGVLIAPGLLVLFRLLGFEVGLRVAVVVMLATLIPIASAVLRRRPEHFGLAPDADWRGPSASEARRARPPLRTLAYWTISIPFAAGLAAQVGFITHQVAFLTPLVGVAAAGLCLSLTALAAIVGRFILGSLVDRTDPRLAASANFLLQAAGLALLVWRPSTAAVYAGCAVFGLGVGNVVSLPGMLVHRDFPLAQFAGVVSLVAAANQVAFAFAPTVLALLRDATGAYTAALGLCIALQGLAAVVVLVGRRQRERAGSETAPNPILEVIPMLQLRPGCECCDRDLPPHSRDAFICSFECTFCRDCAERVLGGICPNCGGELVRRPVRAADRLSRFPPSAERVFKPEGCARQLSA
jgi:predicted MFS family arabinose efflux permease